MDGYKYRLLRVGRGVAHALGACLVDLRHILPRALAANSPGGLVADLHHADVDSAHLLNGECRSVVKNDLGINLARADEDEVIKASPVSDRSRAGDGERNLGRL